MTFRRRILLLAAAAALVPAAGLSWWSQARLQPLLVDRAAASLEAGARAASTALEGDTLDDPAADRLGRDGGMRVTLIGPDGTVLGDSEVPGGQIAGMESQADRPEVAAALRGREGRASRVSETLAVAYLYVAVPHPDGVVRVATPLERATAPADRVGRAAAATGAGIFLLLLVLSGPLERFAAAPFRRLREDAEAVADGELSLRHREPGGGEAGEMARALDRLADRLEEAERERRREEELADVFDRLDEGLAVVDGGGQVRRANAAFRDWVGRREVEGERLDSLFRDPEVTDALEAGVGGEPAAREVQLGERTALVSVRPHGDGAVVVLRDLTRLRRLEGVRRDFVANVSHELKTPLTSVIGYAEPLTDPDLPREQVAEFSERILENGRRMRRLVDELLDLSRIEAGAWEPEPEAVRVGPVARAAWRDLEPGRTGAAELEVEGGETAVRADPEALRQILSNLLDNAARYAPEGTAVRVRCRTAGGDGPVRVEVSDQGPGIPEAHRERLFERFYRVDAGRSRAEGGTGLGLSIVKHLVAAHGGEVGVESEVGEGTTVRFTLPSA